MLPLLSRIRAAAELAVSSVRAAGRALADRAPGAAQAAQSMVEYAIIAAIVAIIAVAAVQNLGGRVSAAFTKAGEQVDSAVQTTPNNGGNP